VQALLARLSWLEGMVETLLARVYLLERRIAALEQQNSQRYNNQAQL
jgi:hypothetical protein